jgi:hypothetical protein
MVCGVMPNCAEAITGVDAATMCQRNTAGTAIPLAMWLPATPPVYSMSDATTVVQTFANGQHCNPITPTNPRVAAIQFKCDKTVVHGPVTILLDGTDACASLGGYTFQIPTKYACVGEAVGGGPAKKKGLDGSASEWFVLHAYLLMVLLFLLLFRLFDYVLLFPVVAFCLLLCSTFVCLPLLFFFV